MGDGDRGRFREAQKFYALRDGSCAGPAYEAISGTSVHCDPGCFSRSDARSSLYWLDLKKKIAPSYRFEQRLVPQLYIR